MRLHPAISMLTVGAIVGACGADNASSNPAPATTLPEASAIVEHVVDGDTLDLIIDGQEVRVRLIGVDTPESVARDQPIECYGKEASAFTESLIPAGTEVRLERDVEPRDDFGRLLVYVYRASDGALVNLELVRNGYAQPLTIPPNLAFADVIVEAARVAEEADVGLWSACAG